ncbi:MAG: pyridoxal phosphate-dependent aminotransferase family protein, partial [Deltaproteobacteria bacterium]
MDLFDKCEAMVKQVRETRAAGIYAYYRALSSAQEPVVRLGDRELVMLGSNNYLGLANHPEVKEAAAEALAFYGTGVAGSRLLNGTLDLHLDLEQKLAAFTRREAALT